MPYHVYIWQPEGGRRGRGQGFYFVNLTEDDLRARVVDAWNAGRPITWEGRTADSIQIETIQVFETEDPVDASLEAAARHGPMSAGRDVTNEVITGPAGSRAMPAGSESVSPLRDPRRVMVVHGRNLAARDAMFTFLRALGLRPIEWEQAVGETGLASPHNLDAVRAAMDIGQAVVILLTAEDRAGLLPQLAKEGDDDVLLRGQPRQNVILEAGLAMGVDRSRTILVELGPIRRASDFDGLNVVRLTNDAPTRQALRTRLQNAGCEIDESASDWIRSEAGGDFVGCLVGWEPEASSNDGNAPGSVEAQEESQRRLQAAARLLRTELLDIRNKVDMFRKSPIIPDGFSFPASEWTAYRELVAKHPDLYSTLEDAYTRAHRVNEIFRWRRTVSTSRSIGVNWDEDGLNDVDDSAQGAIAAVDAVIGETARK